MRTKIVILILLVSLLVACAPKKEEMPTAVLPAGKAFTEGKEIFFVHTEASDEGCGEIIIRHDGIACALRPGACQNTG